jgi:hypothetical protein
VRGPATVTTRAISIAAPPARVWSWLVQIGTDRGGWYSYDRLERLAGVPVRSTDEVRVQWQHLTVGDGVQLAPPGWLGTKGMVLPVVAIRKGEAIVLRQQPPDSPWDGVWSFHVRADGDGCSRVLIRSRTAAPHGVGRVASALLSPFGDLVTCLMERGMLRGLKARAQAGAGPGGERSGSGTREPESRDAP